MVTAMAETKIILGSTTSDSEAPSGTSDKAEDKDLFRLKEEEKDVVVNAFCGNDAVKADEVPTRTTSETRGNAKNFIILREW